MWSSPFTDEEEKGPNQRKISERKYFVVKFYDADTNKDHKLSSSPSIYISGGKKSLKVPYVTILKPQSKETIMDHLIPNRNQQALYTFRLYSVEYDEI